MSFGCVRLQARQRFLAAFAAHFDLGCRQRCHQQRSRARLYRLSQRLDEGKVGIERSRGKALRGSFPRLLGGRMSRIWRWRAIGWRSDWGDRDILTILLCSDDRPSQITRYQPELGEPWFWIGASPKGGDSHSSGQGPDITDKS